MAVDGVAVDVVMALVAGAEVGGNFVVDRFWFYRFLVLGATVFGSSKTKRSCSAHWTWSACRLLSALGYILLYNNSRAYPQVRGVDRRFKP